MEEETHSLRSAKNIGTGCLDADLANFAEYHTEGSGGSTPACTLEGPGEFPPFTDLCGQFIIKPGEH